MPLFTQCGTFYLDEEKPASIINLVHQNKTELYYFASDNLSLSETSLVFAVLSNQSAYLALGDIKMSDYH